MRTTSAPAPRPLRLALAVVAVAGIVLGGSWWATGRVESDLTARAEAVLAAQELPVSVTYQGRDAVLTGSVTEGVQAGMAIGLLTGVDGTRHVTSRLTLVESQPEPEFESEPGALDVRLPRGAILFAADDAGLTVEAKRYLDDVATFLLAHPSLRLVVRGHSDNLGPDEINWALSQQRATVVVHYLTTRRVGPERLRAEALAATSPVALNTTGEGRAANRRVELEIEEGP